jgi:predicted nucleic acid-binding protein
VRSALAWSKILDNTALSALAHIDKLDITSKIFRETYIPECVYYEGVTLLYTLGHSGQEGKNKIRALARILFKNIYS